MSHSKGMVHTIITIISNQQRIDFAKKLYVIPLEVFLSVKGSFIDNVRANGASHWFFCSFMNFAKYVCQTPPLPLVQMHYGLQFSVSKILNFPLESPSQIAPKFYCLVEQCRTKNSTWVEAKGRVLCKNLLEKVWANRVNWFYLISSVRNKNRLSRNLFFENSVRSGMLFRNDPKVLT